MTFIIGISGRRQSGKDTLGGLLAKTMTLADPLVMGFADGIRQELIEKGWPSDMLYGTNEAKEVVHRSYGMSGRQAMQQHGESKRAAYPFYWIRKAFHASKGRNVIFTDVRFPDEVESIRAMGGRVIRLLRKPFPYDTHISETALDGYTGFDAYMMPWFTPMEALAMSWHMIKEVWKLC